MIDYLAERMKEPSTWRGIIWCLSAFGVWHLTDDQSEAIIALGMALAGGTGIVTRG